MPKQYYAFLDESGTKEYTDDKVYSDGVTPVFAFGAVVVTPAEASNLHHALRGLKQRYFGTPDVEIKANWLRHPKERERRYLKPFALTDARLNEFAEKTYEMVAASQSVLIGCAVNKAEVQDAYAQPHYAPAIAYDCTLQRIQHEMLHSGWPVSHHY